MPKLLSLNNYNYRRGGSDVVFLDHDEMFENAGWETAVFTMNHPRNQPSPWSEFFVDELEFGHEYGILDKILMAGKVVYSLEAKRKVSDLLDRFSADIAHAHCIYHHLSPSVLVELKRRSIPIVMTAHDLKLACPAYKMLNSSGICEKCNSGSLVNVALNRCLRGSLAVSGLVMVESMVHKALGLYKKNLDRIVVPSKFYGQKLVEWGWSIDSIKYIPNYVDAVVHVPEFLPGNYFFYFGRLAPEKGVATLIRAASRAGVKLLIAGTGPEESFLKSQAAELTADVEFLGFVSGSRLWDLVRNSRAVVLPSEWYENAPMSVLESYALGKPVIGSRLGGIPEIVKCGQTGILFEHGDVDSLSYALRQFSSMSNDSISEMGREARIFVCSNFTPDRYFTEMQILYSELGVEVGSVGARYV